MSSSRNRKGIILAGGRGTRLMPISLAISKQLMPIYDKPMVYYPLTTLMLSGIKDILLICNPNDIESFKRLLGDGTKWGIKLKYKIQPKPEGIAQAFLIAEDFLEDCPAALILGDNLFHGQSLVDQIRIANTNFNMSTLFAYRVNDPKRYGIVELDNNNDIVSIEEKPNNPRSNHAITGLYFYNNDVVKLSKQLYPSSRGELEITDLNRLYLDQKKLKVELLGRGTAWLDTGTFESLHEASSFIKTIENRQGLQIGSPEEVSWRMGWINDNQLKELAKSLKQSKYGEYLKNLVSKK